MRRGIKVLLGFVGFLVVLQLSALAFSPPSPRSLGDGGDVAVQPRWYFLHFHKVGGTELCRIMRNSPGTIRLAGYQHQHNCNLLSDHPRSWKLDQVEAGVDTCSALDAEYRASGTDVIAREDWFDYDGQNGTLCPGIKYFTLMREPVSRIVSHLRYEFVSAGTALAWLDDESEYVTAVSPIPGNKHVGPFVLDNFYIRMLLFQEAFFLPLGGITARHYEKAKALLDQFYMAMPIERWSDGVDRVFGDLYHWNVHNEVRQDTSYPWHARVNYVGWAMSYVHTRVGYSFWHWMSTDADVERLYVKLHTLNKWDTMLYNHVERTFSSKLEEIIRMEKER